MHGLGNVSLDFRLAVRAASALGGACLSFSLSLLVTDRQANRLGLVGRPMRRQERL